MDKSMLIYDIEVTPYCFIYGDFNVKTDNYNTFVISQHRDDRIEFKKYLQDVIKSKSWQVGFNNLDYDYPMIHYILQLMNKKYYEKISIDELLEKINSKNKQLIPDDKKKKSNKFGKNYNTIYNPLIKQIDLYKIHHFDNKSRRTSLKKVEINMRFPNVQDFDWSKFKKEKYTYKLEEELIDYNMNDVIATTQLYYLTRGQLDKAYVKFPGKEKYYSSDKIAFRINIGKRFGIKIINANDVKIGEEIGKHTYLKLSGKNWNEIRKLRTFREYVVLKNLIPDYIIENIKHKELLILLDKIKETVIDVNNPKFNYVFVYAGNKWSFGLGGIHTQDEARIITPDKDEMMSELDGGSQYPSAIIALNVYPAHLGPQWNVACKTIKDERIHHKHLGKQGNKHSQDIALAFKYSLNGNFYGKLGDKYNYQFDPLQKYRVTIKCQLDIMMYTQMLIDNIPDIKIMSGNTDGIVAIYKKKYIDKLEEINKKWSKLTGIEMERTDYSKLIQRDINNYIAIKTDGKVKLKGIFELEKELHKDFSFQIIPIALYEYFVNGKNVEEVIKNHDNIYDFLGMIRVQNTKQGKWELRHNYLYNGHMVTNKIQKINRYYIINRKDSTITKHLIGTDKKQFIEVGYNTWPLNIVDNTKAQNYDINYNYYIKKVKEIINEIEPKQTNLFDYYEQQIKAN